ncbi:MAG: class I SAM-dependent methyltransferase [Sedimentisphaerales bacterium]|nr:class I SAM-dependent methyltransferase [Sedimentisphaerales bacterium]
MKRNYWDNVADRFETEIFDVFKHDREGRILKKLDRYKGTNKSAGDIGCGIGNFLPAMAKRFKKVIAADISPKCIARAKEKYSYLANVSYRTVDLSGPGVRLPKVDVALCVNTILTASLAQRIRILDVVCRHVQGGGHLVLVVPALESAFLAHARLIEWNLRDGISPRVAARASFQIHRHAENRRLHEGIVRIDNVETKHYLKEELVMLLQARSMEIREMEKIEYPWTTEFTSPPRWMKEPYPWDWLVVAHKIK